MKAEKSIKEELVRNLEEWLERLNRDLKYCIERIASSESVEQVMLWKRCLLLMITTNLPLYASHCYFCLKYRMDCSRCEYAKVHGRCLTENSDYRKILDKVKELNKLIGWLYYRDESYDQA